MTCIVGILENEKVWIGGDSAGVGGLEITIRKDPKVFKTGEFIIGCTSSFRMIQLLQFSFDPPAPTKNHNLYEFMCTTFIEKLRTCFKKGGFLKKHYEQESGGEFLVGIRNRLFKIDSDFQVSESIDNYASCGCGEAYALGVLYSTKSLKPEERIKKALECSTYFNAGVRPPFIIISN